MNRKLVWLSILSILFLIWGASGSAMIPHKAFLAQSTFHRAADTPVAGEVSKPLFIPVTGTSHLGWGTLLFYGLVELSALTLILALLDAANRSTGLCARRKQSQEKNRKP
jgi:hypothetical protein